MPSGYKIQFEPTEKLTPIGYRGSLVHKVAAQLLQVIETSEGCGHEVARTLATPVTDDDARIDWYSDLGDQSRPLNELTAEESGPVRALLGERLAKISALADTLSGEGKTDTQRDYGEILRHAVRYPGDHCVRVIDGQPVIVFWGFEGVGFTPVPEISTDARGVTEPKLAAVRNKLDDARDRLSGCRPRLTGDWRRWLKILLLVLLALWLLSLLRGCDLFRPTLQDSVQKGDLTGFYGRWSMTPQTKIRCSNTRGSTVVSEGDIVSYDLDLNEDGSGTSTFSCPPVASHCSAELTLVITGSDAFTYSTGIYRCEDSSPWKPDISVECVVTGKDKASCIQDCANGKCRAVFERQG